MPTTVTENFEDTTYDITFTTKSGADKGWLRTNQRAYNGSWSFGSDPALGNSAGPGLYVYASTQCTAPANATAISFFYRYLSEAGWDYLRIYQGATKIVEGSGTGSWTQYSGSCTGGDVFTFEYSKDNATSSSDDRAYIDTVVFTVASTLSGTGNLSMTDSLSGSVKRSANATGNVVLTDTLTGAGVRSQFASGSLSNTDTLDGTMIRDLAASGGLTIADVLDGTVALERFTSGNLANTDILSGEADVFRTLEASGDIDITAVFNGEGSVYRFLEASGDLSLTVVLDGSMAADRGISGSVSLSANLTGAGVLERVNSGSLALTGALSGSIDRVTTSEQPVANLEGGDSLSIGGARRTASRGPGPRRLRNRATTRIRRS